MRYLKKKRIIRNYSITINYKIMRNSLTSRLFALLVILLALSVSANGFSQKKPKGKLPKGTVKLEYIFPANKPISYLSTTKVLQTMEVEGQTFEVNANIEFGCTVMSSGKQDGNLKLEIRVDTLYQNQDTPQGSTGGTVREVQGKVFNMLLSRSGAEVDLSEAEKITFNLEGSGESNLAQSFVSYFPDLPEKPVKPGNTWITNDTVRSKSPSASENIIVQSDNKYLGIEKIDGINCAKITATLTGTREQKLQTMGMDIFIKGSFTGTGELFFAVKEGYFIKQVVTTKMNGNIDITGDQNMSFPMVMDMVSTNAIKK